MGIDSRADLTDFDFQTKGTIKNLYMNGKLNGLFLTATSFKMKDEPEAHLYIM